jgi:ABC-2 type transport system ATP-binding protein
MDLDLIVEPGTILGYLGPNGAGKTTTIRLLMGLLRPAKGAARVMGFDAWSQRNEVHARTGYLPGDFVAYRDMTGEDYLRYISRLRGLDAAEATDELAKRFEVDLSRRISVLSHGNRQKIGIIQALMHDPAVLILDEPTAGLDPLVQLEFLQVLRERRNQGCTIVFSSHVLSEVEAIADTVAMLRKGRLVAQRSIAELRSNATRRVELTLESVPDAAALRRAAGVLDVSIEGNTAQVAASGSLADLFRVAAPFGVHNVVTHEPDLEDVFLSYFGKGT